MSDITQLPLPDRLRGYAKDESGWHCIEDTCEAAADRIETLEAALREAIDEVEFWGSYASDYFKDKHGLAETLADLRSRAALKQGERE